MCVEYSFFYRLRPVFDPIHLLPRCLRLVSMLAFVFDSSRIVFHSLCPLFALRFGLYTACVLRSALSRFLTFSSRPACDSVRRFD